MSGEHLKGRDFLRVGDWTADELTTLLDLADELKTLQQDRSEHAAASRVGRSG